MKKPDREIPKSLRQDEQDYEAYLELLGRVMKAKDDAARDSAFTRALGFRERLSPDAPIAEEILIEELHVAWWALKTNEKGAEFNRMTANETLPEKRSRN